MPVDIGSIRDIILAKVGAGLEGDDEIDQILLDKVTPLFDAIWARWEWKNYYPNLQVLYVTRECVELLQGQLRDLVDAKLGANLTLSQSSIMANLVTIQQQTTAEIQQAEAMASQSRGSVIGELRKRTFAEVPPWYPNPSSPRYRGDPLYQGYWGTYGGYP